MGAKIALEQRCERGKHALLTEKHNAIKVRNLLKKKTRENDALRQQLEDSNAQRVGLEFVSAGLATGFADSDSRALVDRCRADNPESSAHVVKGVRVALDAVTRQYREEVKQRRKAAEETRRVRRKLENQRDDATELLERVRAESTRQLRALRARLAARPRSAPAPRAGESAEIRKVAVAPPRPAMITLDGSSTTSSSAEDDGEEEEEWGGGASSDELEVLAPTRAARAPPRAPAPLPAPLPSVQRKQSETRRRQHLSFARGAAVKPLRPACDNGVWIKRGRDATGRVRNFAVGSKRAAAPACGAGGGAPRPPKKKGGQLSMSRWVSSIE
jgi:hypothetical protein